MDRAISAAAAVLIAAWTIPLTAAQAGQGTVEAAGTLVLPKDTTLDSSISYEAKIKVGPRTISATFRPAASTQGPGASQDGKTKDGKTPGDVPGQPPASGGASPAGAVPPAAGIAPSTVWLWVALAALGAAALCAGALWFYFRRYAPRKEMEREREPYARAMQALRERRYEDALRDLTQVETKLPAEQRADARFFIGLCHFHIGDESEAERMLAALSREQPGNLEVAYFLAYLRIKRGRDAEAEPVLAAMQSGGHLGYRDASWLMSIVKFRRGMVAYQAGQIDLAAELFAEVASLGHLAAHIPSDLRNRHIVLGTRALFDQDLTAAREHFDALSRVAAQTGDDSGRALQARAKLGLALAMWIENDPREAEPLETALVDTCLSFHAGGAVELPWPEPQPGSAKGDAEALKRALEAADKNFNLPAEEKNVLRCLRDLHLLRALVVLRGWSRLDGAAAHKAIADTLAAVMSRLACSRAIDERFSDVYLVAGLLLFYLHPPGPERTTGVDLLLEARKLGMRDPDAMEIVNNRERIERENAGAVDKYEQVLDRYLRDDTVRKEVRLDLLSRLSTHRSLMNRYKPPNLTRARSVPPTVREMKDRSETLHLRIGQISRKSPSQRLQQLGSALKEHSDELALQAAAIEKTEADLLALTGEELFKDE